MRIACQRTSRTTSCGARKSVGTGAFCLPGCNILTSAFAVTFTAVTASALTKETVTTNATTWSRPTLAEVLGATTSTTPDCSTALLVRQYQKPASKAKQAPMCNKT